jgi:hypothetical protein
MVETPYALTKYIAAKNTVFGAEDVGETEFLFNLETETGYQHLGALASVASQPNGVQGMVFGRVDFAGSMGLNREEINSQKITGPVLHAAETAKALGLDFVLGGAISSDTLTVIRQVAEVHLTRFETRKVVFSGSANTVANIEQGLINAVHFELLWLTNKRDYYERITAEDAKRIEMLDSRWKLLNN